MNANSADNRSYRGNNNPNNGAANSNNNSADNTNNNMGFRPVFLRKSITAKTLMVMKEIRQKTAFSNAVNMLIGV